MLYSDGYYCIADSTLIEYRDLSGTVQRGTLFEVLKSTLSIEPPPLRQGARPCYTFKSRRKYLQGISLGIVPTPTSLILDYLSNPVEQFTGNIYREIHPITLYADD